MSLEKITLLYLGGLKIHAVVRYTYMHNWIFLISNPYFDNQNAGLHGRYVAAVVSADIWSLFVGKISHHACNNEQEVSPFPEE